MSDDKTNGTEVKKQAGRRRKGVKKSPKKSSSAPEDDSGYCPCEVFISEELSIKCDHCGIFWHLCCVGLSGLTEESVESLLKWHCPDCFYSPHCKKFKNVTQNSDADSSSCGTIRVLLKEELNLIQPVISATVEHAIRKSFSGNVCSKDDMEKVVKTWADVTKQSQKKVIEETTRTQTAQSVVEKVVRKLDSDKIEREKRRDNVVVMNIPESTMESAAQKRADDIKFCREKLCMSDEDIESCWRAGKVDSTKPDYCRPLVVKMADTETADEWTKNGKGFKTEAGFWINRDLCDADRKANFQSRQERRSRMNPSAQSSTSP